MHLQLNLSVEPPPLKHQKLLAQDTRNKRTTPEARVDLELDRYMQEATDVVTDNSLF